MNSDIVTGTIGNMSVAYRDIVNKQIDTSSLWNDTSEMYALRDYIAKEVSAQNDLQALEQLKKAMKTSKDKTPEEKVIDIVKGGFEAHFGMTIEEFQKVYETIVEKNPEKLL